MGARLTAQTIPQNSAHKAMPRTTSLASGEKIRMKPLPFTRAEKLETQKGIRKSRNIVQRSNRTLVAPAVALRYRAIPIMTLRPSEVSQSRGLGSKYHASATRYQIK